MELIADGLLIAGALAAAFYCWVLSVRVRGLKDLDQGLGAAIAGLSNQVTEMRTALKTTQSSAGASADHLRQSTEAAEAAAERLAALLARYGSVDTAAPAPIQTPVQTQAPRARTRPEPVAAQPEPQPAAPPMARAV